KAGREGQGLLLAESGPPASRRMSRRSLEMVSRFAAHAALALRNADLKAEVARLAASDPLTGLANRRALTTALAREVARSVRTKEPLSLAILDIDFFKKINDTYGHVAGDDVLREVADAMATSVRDVDLVARYGGEEFAIVLPTCPSDGALIVVERVRAAVAALATVAKVTVSAGIATATGAGTADAERLMADADEALYASKRAGRDRATLAPPPPPPPSASPALAL
ncbi:MAG: GGDEF domain-containing protein, partial [Acidimicrobiales bacterium]